MWLRLVLKLSVILAVGIQVAFSLTLLYRCLSRMRLYEEIRIGMPMSEARHVLQREGLACGFGEAPLSTRTTLHFSDHWRTYSVTLDGHEGRVRAKSFRFRRPQGAQDWVLEMINALFGESIRN